MSSLKDFICQYFRQSVENISTFESLSDSQLNELSQLLENGADNLIRANAKLKDIQKAEKLLIDKVLPLLLQSNTERVEQSRALVSASLRGRCWFWPFCIPWL